MLALQSLILSERLPPPSSSPGVVSHCPKAPLAASPVLGLKDPASAPALEQHKSDGEADGDAATGRAGVPDKRGQGGVA